MNWARMPGLLPALRNVFGEPAYWATPGSQLVSIVGRFRIDPYEVPLGGQSESLNVTQTWFYCDQADVPTPAKPRLGDNLTIRGQNWEIVEIAADDIGELGFRLVKVEDTLSSTDVEQRRPGRPSLRDEIERAYALVAPTLPPDAPLTAAYPAIRRTLTGSEAPSQGLTDKTLRKTLTPLRRQAGE
jgi:hypothetical protein